MSLWVLLAWLGLACARPQESPGSPAPLPATAPPALSKVSLGTSKTIADTVLFVGMEKQFFQQQGLDVELENLGTAETAIPALAGEQIQVAGLGIAAGLFNAINRGIPIKIVADKASNYAGQFLPGRFGETWPTPSRHSPTCAVGSSRSPRRVSRSPSS